MPRKFRLGRHYKNEERKKRAKKMQANIDATEIAEMFVVSLPLSLFTKSAVGSSKARESRLEASSGVPHGKSYLLTNLSS